MIHITDKSHCCGCEACAQACPKRCISFVEDNEGFRYPNVDVSQCVDCGACEKVCPFISPHEARRPFNLHGAINPDEEVRLQSSSGGIFTMLAERVIREGGIVFGVRFDESWQPVFDHTETLQGLAAFRGSKYVQAQVGNAFNEVRDFLRKGRKVLFAGTPCQVAALRHFLHRKYDNLLCVDFICHGVPSPKVWRLYLNEVTENAVRAISDVQFRNKKQGWKRFNFDLTYNSEGHHYNISCYHRENHFMRIFLDNVILRPSCYDCKAKEGRSGSDLTIADFWGINKLLPEKDDDRGTSLIMVNTKKGEDYFRQCKAETWEVQYDDIVKYNQGLGNSHMHPKRNQFFERLDTSESVSSLIDETLRAPILLRIKRFPKRLLRKLWHMIGGGNSQIDISTLKPQSTTEVAAKTLLHPAITGFTFRSKHYGWKRYRMVISISEKEQ